MIAPDGTFGHPSLDQGPRHLSDGNAEDRTRAALSWGNDARFLGLVARFSRLVLIRACTHKPAFCKRVSVNFRFAPKATELLLCRN